MSKLKRPDVYELCDWKFLFLHKDPPTVDDYKKTHSKKDKREVYPEQWMKYHCCQ
jgi:hypothetical protein